MTTLRLYFDNERVGPKIERAVDRFGARAREAMRGAARDMVDEIRVRAAADMAAAGRFGARWQQGLHATITEGGGNIRVDIGHDVSYWWVFQYSATIRGKPLLWIPLSFAQDAQGVYARDFPGGLFRVDRKNGKAPLLLSFSDKQPKYFGKESVFEPKKFHTVEIARDVVRHFGDLYRERFAHS